MCAYVRGYLSRGQLMLHHGQVITICIKRPFYFEKAQKIWKHLRFLATERFSFVLPCSLGVCLYIICLSAFLLSICISWTALGRNGRGDKAPKHYWLDWHCDVAIRQDDVVAFSGNAEGNHSTIEWKRLFFQPLPEQWAGIWTAAYSIFEVFQNKFLMKKHRPIGLGRSYMYVYVPCVYLFCTSVSTCSFIVSVYFGRRMDFRPPLILKIFFSPIPRYLGCCCAESC